MEDLTSVWLLVGIEHGFRPCHHYNRGVAVPPSLFSLAVLASHVEVGDLVLLLVTVGVPKVVGTLPANILHTLALGCANVEVGSDCMELDVVNGRALDLDRGALLLVVLHL